MNFIVYGNEDSPVVPILIYQPGKVWYVCVHASCVRGCVCVFVYMCVSARTCACVHVCENIGIYLF